MSILRSNSDDVASCRMTKASYHPGMPSWRIANAADDDALTSMSVALYGEGSDPEVVSPTQVRQTLHVFRESPLRGRALVLEAEGTVIGYAFLVSFWSNELGGEICTIDELFVQPGWRGQGSSTALLRSLQRGDELWPGRPVALELEVSPANTRARALYERLGFVPKRNATLRLTVPSRQST
jgi:GNAT superfamily N-acetyltransferase